MTEPALSNEAMQLGLLMEAARAQQHLGEESLERLAAHTRNLEGVVRDELQRALAEQLGNITAETRRAAESLRSLRRAASLRVLLWTVCMAAIGSGVGLAEAWWLLPSERQLSALRARRDELSENIARLQRRGALLEVRTCGQRGRLCVRVDRSAPAYGPSADYLIVKGY